MRLRDGGIDIFYIDESHDQTLYVVTAIAVPFLRKIEGVWTFVWNNHLDEAGVWRRQLSEQHKIPLRKELHGRLLATRRGNYKFGKRQFSEREALAAYSDALASVSFVPDGSIMSVSGQRGRTMYGSERLLRVMHALFQRMRLQCRARNVNAFTFFDGGHPEYRSLYRKAQVHLETGNRAGEMVNRPLDMFIKDANMKDSRFCHFTQAADLIAYAALQKIRREIGVAEGEKTELYDNLPQGVINLRVSERAPRDGILRLG